MRKNPACHYLRLILLSGITVLSVVILKPYSAYAHQNPNSSESDDIIIVTGSGNQRALNKTALSVSQLSQTDIENIAAIRVGEIFANVPGVVFSGLNGPREIAQIRQPLAFDNRVLFLEDGVPLQSSVFFDQSALAYSLALAAPGTIEVLRGPGTALYGSDALTGVIHIRSRDIPTQSRISFRARGGQFGLYDTAGEIGGPLSDEHRLSLTAAGAGEDGFRDQTAFNRQHVLVKHVFEPHADFEIGTNATWSRYETESATAIPFEDFLNGSRASGLSPTIDPEDVIERGEYARIQSTLRTQLSETLTFTATPYWRRQEISASAVFQPATIPRTDATVSTFGILPRLFWKQTHGETVAGVDVELTDFDRFTFQDAPDTVVFGSLFRQGVQFDYSVRYRGLSPYIQHTQEFGNLIFDIGLRYDELQYQFDNRLVEIPGDARLQLTDRTDRFSALSPKASLLWEVSDRHSLFTRYARGFRIPRESDLYELEEGQTDFQLEPERLDSIEAGWRGNFQNLSAELVGYWSVSRDGLITDIQTAAGNITINGASSRFAGIEFSTAVRLPANFELSSAFAFQDFRFRQRSADGPDPFDGNLISQSPRTLGSISLSQTIHQLSDWQNTIRLRHIGRWALNDANTLFTDRTFILDYWSAISVSRNLQFELKIENITNSLFPVFANAPSFAPAGRARPGVPRTVSAGFRTSF